MSAFYPPDPWDNPEAFHDPQPAPPGDIIVVSGSRHHSDIGMVERYLRRWLATLPKGTVIRTGGANGIDQLAARLAEELGLRTETISPDYAPYPRGRRWEAPLDRNTILVNGGELHGRCFPPADKVLAFPDNLEGKGGTWDTIRKGRATG